MKKMILLMSIILIVLSSCFTGSSNLATKKQAEECIAPHNPYNDGSSHDAGFDWARLDGGKCDNRFQSFNEGCSEYYRQLTQYNKCIAKNPRGRK
jgi:hypothetical protein